MRRVLGIPVFRRLAGAAIVNELALIAGEIALALLVYHRTGSAIGATAFFLCAQVGPAFVSPLVVTRLDQIAARPALVLIYALQALIFVLLGELLASLAIPVVLLAALIQGSLAVSARVLSRAAWTSITQAGGLLRDASAVVNFAASMCFFVGPALGGGLVALGGTRLALLVNAGLFALCIGAVGTTKDLPRPIPDRTSVLRRVRSAIVYARREPIVRRLLSLQAVFMIFFTISIPVELVFARETLHAGAAGYGLLLSAWGGGATLGSVVYARWRRTSSRVLVSLGATFVGLGLLPMAVAPDLAVAVLGACIAGIGNGIEIVAVRTVLQETAPAKSMAMILSLNESLLLAMPGIGIIAGGAITALAGPRLALGVGAAGALAVGVAMWTILPSSRAEGAMRLRPADAELEERGVTVAARRP
ncbi:MAG TPA: MFS transporter [Solirubrobacteraceae bacterium]|nr:MFS transporter [Solirubrobacteraceae bacterium]